ncbi:MAG: HAD family hydrolase [Mycobacteriales bacterium]
MPPSPGSLPRGRRIEGIRAIRAAGAVVAIVTNGPPTQEIKIRTTGLDKVVDGYAVSMIEGVSKPDVEMFERAAENCGTSLNAMTAGFMVGDNAVADIGGARNAGLTSVWVTLGREWPEDGYRPDHAVDHVRDGIGIVLDALS